jgi:hypothetical protein
VTFKLNDFQKSFIRQRAGHRRNKVIKYRQGGFTTFRCIELLDKALWVPGMTCAIVAHEREAVTKIFRIVKRALDNLPDELKPKIKYNNRSELEFIEDFTGRKLDSSIYVALKLRSGTVQYLHISESAFIEGETRLELNAGTKETVPLSGDITEETTANGLNEFYDEIQNALKEWDNPDIPQKYKTKTYFFSWLENPEYRLKGSTVSDLDAVEEKLVKLGADSEQLAWRRWKISGYGRDTSLRLRPEQVFKQEYPATLEEAFQHSGGMYFDTEFVEAVQPRDPIQTKKFDGYGNLSIWCLPEEGKKYVIGVDPSQNKGMDNACIDVWEVESMEQVAQFYGYIDADLLGYFTAEVAKFYNKAFVGVENNIQTAVLALKEVYPTSRIYKHVKQDRITEKRTDELGFNTNSKTRWTLINGFAMLLREGGMKINSFITKAELRTFITKDNGKVEHADGKNDDALFAAFIAIFCSQFVRRKVNLSWS